mmetsp:Transcript_4082/g.11612  ORF Transcript_4082/g.11612 Transcript_4082/m.11612 type:complete len:304 (-) Transcript_4082:824-1735(-)
MILGFVRAVVFAGTRSLHHLRTIIAAVILAAVFVVGILAAVAVAAIRIAAIVTICFFLHPTVTDQLQVLHLVFRQRLPTTPPLEALQLEQLVLVQLIARADPPKQLQLVQLVLVKRLPAIATPAQLLQRICILRHLTPLLPQNVQLIQLVVLQLLPEHAPLEEVDLVLLVVVEVLVATAPLLEQLQLVQPVRVHVFSGVLRVAHIRQLLASQRIHARADEPVEVVEVVVVQLVPLQLHSHDIRHIHLAVVHVAAAALLFQQLELEELPHVDRLALLLARAQLSQPFHPCRHDIVEQAGYAVVG